MKFLTGIGLGLLLSAGFVVGVSQGASAPELPIVSVATVLETTTTTTTTTTIAPDDDAKCPQWWNVAISAGWEQDDLRDLDEVLWRESRCDPTQVNASDPNTVDGVKGSVGLTQVNVFWVQGTKYYPNGYLQTVSIVSGVRDLFDPFLNLRAAKAIFDYGKARGGCGWQAWAWKGCH